MELHSQPSGALRENGLPHEVISDCVSLSLQPSPEVVKEMVQFSKDTLEKIDKARSEGLYHEVRALLMGDSDWEEGGELGRCVNRKTRPMNRVCFLEGCFYPMPFHLSTH